MKKILSGLALLAFVMTADAQTSKDDWMVGGNFRLNTANNFTQIAFTPNAGTFVTDNFVLGGNFSLAYSKFGTSKTTSFSVGPFVRYYFTTETQSVRPIVHGAINYISQKNKFSNTSYTQNGSNYFIGGGAAIFLSNQVSLDALLGYDRTDLKNEPASGGFAFNIGFQVYLLKAQVEKVRGK